MRLNTRFLFLNAGHAVDHLMMLVFPTAAVFMAAELNATYGELLFLSTAGFIAFGACSLPAGWLADRWSREAMIALFFIGIGCAAALTGLADGRLQIAAGLLAIGVFAAIYHPVGIAMVSQGGGAVGRRLGINGVWGNMGVAAAPLLTAFLCEAYGWRAAFLVPSVLCVTIGGLWLLYCRSNAGRAETAAGTAARKANAQPSLQWKRILAIVFFATAVGGFIFNATTIALPKIFDERVMALTEGASRAGGLIAMVFAAAAFTQVLVGHLIDRYSIRLVFLVLTVGDIAVFILASNATGSVMIGLALAMMMLVFGQIPITDTLVARNTPEHWRARAYSVKYVLSFVVAATVVPVISRLHGSTAGDGFATLFLICAACATAIAFAVAMLPSARPAVAITAGE
ncbi:probable MFS transporter [alpha proteobacterium BAL199]|jgi:MFS family permease|nr:probable MFS transporter [alpha proteobacterium BAL199]